MSIQAGSRPVEHIPPAIENRKVPIRKANAVYRSREYLSDREVTAMIAAAAAVGRHGTRDAALNSSRLPSRPARVRTRQFALGSD